MCKPKPGPRCATHTRQQLNAARTHYEQTKQAERDIKAVFDAAYNSPDRIGGETPNNAMIIKLPPGLMTKSREATEARRAAALDMIAARKEHDTTLTGQKELKELLAKTTAGSRQEAALQKRLADGQAARAEQLTRWKKYLDNGPGPDLDEVAPRLRGAVYSLQAHSDEAVNGLPAYNSTTDVDVFRRRAAERAHQAAVELCGGDTREADRLMTQMTAWHNHRSAPPGKALRDLVNDPMMPETQKLRANATLAVTASSETVRANARTAMCDAAYSIGAQFEWEHSAKDLYRAAMHQALKDNKAKPRRAA